MVNVKKSALVLKHFVLILTLIVFGSNCSAQLVISKIEAKQININEKSYSLAEYNAYISPYRTHIDNELNTILAVCPETLDKSKGQWQSNIGDFLADATLEKTSPFFKKRENLDIDICILNHGGIRAILPQGDVTTRTAFEIMPFENTTVVVALIGEQIAEFVDYFIKEKKPHPISGITFTINTENKAADIMVGQKPLDLTKTYYVVTSDYLSNGGDNMNFFKKNTKTYDLEYKLRNILIDYFKDVDTIPITKKIKVTQIKQ
ncbi:5'-nucleotidase, C-terminal domain [Flavobacterium swingsii]|uniref:5'-nucleotidase, C-terminal domain n=1 Tax=Flavobacterium swingsii TaxID=498292 RepID=A0A1I0WLZ3_9FLAO|nr:5'-nucleotidase [Flavobacterium swingsii]SFA89180.1 5'-nucleotidase, C-terminal domain [Flavobacterium swingsii]